MLSPTPFLWVKFEVFEFAVLWRIGVYLGLGPGVVFGGLVVGFAVCDCVRLCVRPVCDVYPAARPPRPAAGGVFEPGSRGPPGAPVSF